MSRLVADKRADIMAQSPGAEQGGPVPLVGLIGRRCPVHHRLLGRPRS